MAELLTLPTVAMIDDPAHTVDALRGLGVVGRAEFTRDNRSVLSHLREDGDLLHLYLYHFLYETGRADRGRGRPAWPRSGASDRRLDRHRPPPCAVSDTKTDAPS